MGRTGADTEGATRFVILTGHIISLYYLSGLMEGEQFPRA